MPSGYYDGFRVMVTAPAILVFLVLAIYAVVRSRNRGKLSHACTDYSAEHTCLVGAPSRLHKTPLRLTRGGKSLLGLWGMLDACLDAVEGCCCFCARARRRGHAVPRGTYATLRTAEAVLEVEVTKLGCAEALPRLKTLRLLSSLAGGGRTARLWNGLSILRDDHNMLGGCELCACVPRDPRVVEPARFALCERGRAQYFLLALRMRVSVPGAAVAAAGMLLLLLLLACLLLILLLLLVCVLLLLLLLMRCCCCPDVAAICTRTSS